MGLFPVQRNTVLLTFPLFFFSFPQHPSLTLSLWTSQIAGNDFKSFLYVRLQRYFWCASESFLHLREKSPVTIMCSVTILSVLMAGQIGEACGSWLVSGKGHFTFSLFKTLMIDHDEKERDIEGGGLNVSNAIKMCLFVCFFWAMFFALKENEASKEVWLMLITHI